MKKRILSLALASCLCLSLFTVSASASEALDQMPDVFQGDGVYVTAKELPIPEGWTVYGGVPRGIHEGFVTVFRTEDIQDEDGFYTGGKRYLVNWVDENGNLFDFSDWENPPILHTYNENHTPVSYTHLPWGPVVLPFQLPPPGNLAHNTASDCGRYFIVP